MASLKAATAAQQQKNSKQRWQLDSRAAAATSAFKAAFKAATAAKDMVLAATLKAAAAARQKCSSMQRPQHSRWEQQQE